MDTLYARSAIFIVLVLTSEFTSGYVENGTADSKATAKVVSSFLSVPWINLNSPWPDRVSSDCRDDVERLSIAADAGESWALHMLDATSKIPSGMLRGNVYDLGTYDECVGVKARHNSANIQGQQCKVSLAFPTELITRSDAAAMMLIQKLSFFNPSIDVDFGLSLSVCLPSSCSVEDVQGIADASIRSSASLYKLETRLVEVRCWSVGNSVQNLPVGTIIVISFFVMIAGLLLLSTVCDLVLRSKSGAAPSAVKTFAKFSLYVNAMKLLSTEVAPGTMPAINGIRFLSTFLVIAVHRFIIIPFKPLVNHSDLLEYRQSAVTSVGLVLLYTVDTFFLITGFLTTYTFLRRMKSGVKFDLAVFYLHRYIRLVPCIAILILFNVFIMRYLGSGPLWEEGFENLIDFCRNNWWTNLLFIHNVVNRTEMCLPHTWTSAVEMQLYLICPIILYPLFHRPRLGLVILSVFLVASFVTPAVQIFLYDDSFLLNMQRSTVTAFYRMYYTYIPTYNRALPYFLGIFLGYYVVNHKKQITEVQTASNWILACIFPLCCFWSAYHVQPNSINYNVVWEAVFVSFGRLGWGLSMSWLVYACTQGYGGPVTRFLSLPIFLPLSRLSYGIYLVCMVMQMAIQSTGRASEFFSLWATVHLVWGDLAISIVIASVLNVCIETPMVIFEELIIAKPATKVEPDSIPLKKKSSAVPRDSLDPTSDQTDSNTENAIGKKMSWEQRKSNRLDNGIHRETDPGHIEN